jgi:hypothetical protein
LCGLSGSMRTATTKSRTKANQGNSFQGGWTYWMIGRTGRLTRLGPRVAREGTGFAIHPSIPDPDSTKTIDLGRKSNHRHTSSPRCPCHPSLACPCFLPGPPAQFVQLFCALVVGSTRPLGLWRFSPPQLATPTQPPSTTSRHHQRPHWMRNTTDC